MKIISKQSSNPGYIKTRISFNIKIKRPRGFSESTYFIITIVPFNNYST